MSAPSLYRQYFTPAERKLLLALPADDVSSEIHLLRVLIARTLGLRARQPSRKATSSRHCALHSHEGAEPLSIPQHAALLRAVGGAAIIMASLVGFMAKYHGRTDELSAILLEELSAMDPNDL